jgi:hypothetical protein
MKITEKGMMLNKIEDVIDSKNLKWNKAKASENQQV